MTRIAVITPLLGFLVAVGTLPGCGSTTTRIDTQVVGDDRRGLSVVGVGEADAEPDIARVSIGVEVRAPSVADAVKESNARMEALLAALKQAGVAPSDLRTQNYSIRYEEPHERPPEPLPRLEAQPSAERSAGQATGKDSAVSPVNPGRPMPRPGRFVVRNVAQVTVRDLDRLSEVLGVATQSGANEIWGITFDIDAPEPLRERARQLAMQDAREKAEALAGLAGVKLGRPIAINETGAEMPRPVSRHAMSLESSGVPVERGTLTVTERVEIVYAIGASQE